MPATNRTKNFQLPIYQASDHFSVLGDMNSAMNMIDEKLGEATVQATAAARDATSALAAANDASDNTHIAKESAQSALSVSANAKGDAQRAQTMAEEAKTKSDKAVEMATAASTNATEANRTAATATAKPKSLLEASLFVWHCTNSGVVSTMSTRIFSRFISYDFYFRKFF